MRSGRPSSKLSMQRERQLARRLCCRRNRQELQLMKFAAVFNSKNGQTSTIPLYGQQQDQSIPMLY